MVVMMMMMMMMMMMVVNFVTGCALVNNEMQALVYAQDTECY